MGPRTAPLWKSHIADFPLKMDEYPLRYLFVGQQNVDVAAGGQATSVAAADDDVVVRVQVFDLSRQKFFHVLDFLSGDSELEVIEMLEADLLTLRQARLVFQLK